MWFGGMKVPMPRSTGCRRSRSFELYKGVLQIERKDPTQGALLRQWLEHRVVRAFHDRILPVDATTARICAGLHVPNPKPDRDALIAATALQHDLIVVTRNVNDFAGTGVKLINPWLPVAG
jgi:toxin FitB